LLKKREPSLLWHWSEYRPIFAGRRVARMSDPAMIAKIKKAVSIPVMAKARIGHFVEAQILEALRIDYI